MSAERQLRVGQHSGTVMLRYQHERDMVHASRYSTSLIFACVDDFRAFAAEVAAIAAELDS